MCILSFLPTLRCLGKEHQLNYARNLLSEPNPQKLSPDELAFKEFLMSFLEEKLTRPQEKSWPADLPCSVLKNSLQELLTIQRPLKSSQTFTISRMSTQVDFGAVGYFG